MRSPRLGWLALCVVAGTSNAGHARAQCLGWRDAYRTVGVDSGAVGAQIVFDDGSGDELFVGGSFVSIAGVPLHGAAKWDGARWQPLGDVVNGGSQGAISDLEIFDDGAGPALYAAGSFTSIGGVAANNIAKWDGIAWSALGAGTNNSVRSLAVFDDGGGPTLFAGGSFGTAGGLVAQGLAKWNGSAWSPVSGGFTSTTLAYVNVLHVHDDGTGPALFVGGHFDTAGAATSENVAKWDGTAWSSLGAGVNSYVEALATYDEGSGPRLFIGGSFTAINGFGSAYAIARWNGAGLSIVGNYGLAGGGVNALHVFDDGSGAGSALYVGLTAPYNAYGLNPALVRWNGASFATVGNGSGVVNPLNDSGAWVASLGHYDDASGGGPKLFVSGSFAFADTLHVRGFASWDGAAWQAYGANQTVDRRVHALAKFDDGSGEQLYVAGEFVAAGPISASRIAKFDGANWSTVGSGVGANKTVDALAVFDDGNGAALYAAGAFTSIDGVAAKRVAKWDGSGWSALGTGIGIGGNEVHALAVFDDGAGDALYAAGAFQVAGGITVNRVAKWDGAAWSALGSGLSTTAYALAVHDDGNGDKLYVAGLFAYAGGMSALRVASWDGSQWAALGSGLNVVSHALAVFDDGSGPALFAGANKWDGSTWQSIGSVPSYDTIYALRVHDGGTGPALYAGGDFTQIGGVAAAGVARFDGANWTALGSGVVGEVRALEAFDHGAGPALFAGGQFITAGGHPSVDIAEWSRSCACSPIAYCTAGTTSNGCAAHIGASGTASASSASGFDVLVTGIDGQRQGLFFYGVDGALADPWGSGASWRCVRYPVQRTGVQSSGGTLGSCNGSFALDFNAYLSAHPGALGQPWTAVGTVWMQAWFRDPPSPKGTSLSDALTFDVCP